MRKSFGWLAERSNATVLKTADGATRPGVRIPHHPPPMENVPPGTFLHTNLDFSRKRPTITSMKTQVAFCSFTWWL